jgi:CheY-like chemotaxis protein
MTIAMRRLLVIEDHADMSEMLVLLLQSGGYDVVAAETSRQAARALEKGGFDLVLADLILESADVEAAWRTVDQFVDLARPAPVGLLTAWPIKPDDAPKHDIAFVLRKPITRDQLFERLATTLLLPPLDAERVAQLESYFRFIEHGAYEQLGTLCTDDVVYRLPGSDPRFAHEIRGRRDFLELTAKTFEAFREPRFDISAMRSLPNGAVVEYIASWRDESGEQRMPGAALFQFRDNRFSTVQVRVDTDELK